METPFRINSECVKYEVSVSGGKYEVLIDGYPPLPYSSALTLDPKFDDKEFSVHFYHSPDIGENESRQVFHKKTGVRVGWIIPVSALDSDLHSYRENIHFLRYAYIAIKKCLLADWSNIHHRKFDADSAESFLLSDLFGGSVAVLVISLETLKDGAEFDYKRATPSLLSSGYIPLLNEKPSPYRWPFERPSKVEFLLSSEVPDEHDVVENLLLAFARSSEQPVLQFFFLYQIIELLLERVLSHQYSSVAAKLLEAGQDSSRLKSVIDGLGKTLAESERLTSLTTKYVRHPIDTTSLDAVCRAFIDILANSKGRKKPTSGLSKCLYPVRNAIFHGFRNVPKEGLNSLKLVVQELLMVIPELLASFQVPSEGPDEVGDAEKAGDINVEL